MQETYQKAMTLGVFPAEGGYTNDKADPGGPTNWGITIHDARAYWKSNATAQDVKAMPKSVAEDIYLKHYSQPIAYNLLPPGIDYSILDYSVNSGISKAIKTLQNIVGVTADGIIGPNTIKATNSMDPVQTINKIWDSRLAYDHSLTSLWLVYGHGWTNRYIKGKQLALSLYQQYGQNQPVPEPTPVTPVPNPWFIVIKDVGIILTELSKYIPKQKGTY